MKRDYGECSLNYFGNLDIFSFLIHESSAINKWYYTRILCIFYYMHVKTYAITYEFFFFFFSNSGNIANHLHEENARPSTFVNRKFAFLPKFKRNPNQELLAHSV